MFESMLEYLSAGARGFWVTTVEEERLRQGLSEIAGASEHQLVQWTAAIGSFNGQTITTPPNVEFHKMAALTLDPKSPPTMLVVWDAHHQVTEPSEQRTVNLRVIKDQLRLAPRHIVVLVSPRPTPPEDLDTTLIPLRLSMPTAAEISTAVGRVSRSERLVLGASEAALGLTLESAKLLITKAVQKYGNDPAQVASAVWQNKAEHLAAIGPIKIDRPNETWQDVGGCPNLKKWLSNMTNCFTPEARRDGVPVPEGILLVGPPGTGKSLISRVIANLLGYQHIEWLLSNLFSKWVGDTEHATRWLIDVTERLAHPGCVIKIDEFSHQLAGHDGHGDTGVTRRMVGTLLTSFEEHTAPTFLAASTNEPWNLPQHILRAGRFSRVWHVGLPDADALREILTIHLTKQLPHLLNNLDVKEVSKEMEVSKLTGAEIREAVREARRRSYPKLATASQFTMAYREIVPVAATMAEQVSQITQWAKTRAYQA